MLSGQKVQLTEIRPEDKAPLFAWINDPDLVRLHGPYRPVSPAAHETWFAGIGKDPTHLHFAIREAGGQDIVGIVQLLNLHAEFRSVELTIRLGSATHRGLGFGTEAVHLATEFAFRDLNLNRVSVHVYADNKAALKAYEKAGFTLEGQLRQAAFIDGRWRDVLVLARLRE